ncbi:MAG: GFA family protein, partial [bacterium]
MKIWRTGSCHCGDVRFAVRTPDEVEVEACNCSICARTGFVHLIVPMDDFELTAGADKLTSY